VYANIVQDLEKIPKPLMNLRFGENVRKYLREIAGAEWFAIAGLDFKSRVGGCS